MNKNSLNLELFLFGEQKKLALGNTIKMEDEIKAGFFELK